MSRWLPLRRASLLAIAAATALACGGEPAPLPPPQVDLVRQGDAAAEVIHGGRVQRHLEGLAAGDRSVYVATELQRLGYRPGGTGGAWLQQFTTPRQTVTATRWQLRRGPLVHALQPGRDFVAGLGGTARQVRLRGREVVLVDRALAVAPGAVAGKVVLALRPQPPPGVADAGPAVSDLLRRAAAAGAVGVVLVPPYLGGDVLPDEAAARGLVAGTGLPVAIWVTETAARTLVAEFLGTGLSFVPRLELRADLLPLGVARVDGLAVTAREQRDPRTNVVGWIPAREGGSDEAVALVAALGGAPAGSPEARLEATALAQLLAVAAALQAVSDPPRRSLVVAAVDTSGDGAAGARQLLGLLGEERRLAGAVVLTGSPGGPTEDVRFVGLQASPLASLATRAAATQGRRIAGDPAPWRGVLFRSPAWGFVDAGVPAVLLEPGTVPRRAPDAVPAALPAATPRPRVMRAVAVAPPPPPVSPPPARTPEEHLEALADDARVALRIALELLEAPQPLPRVDPAAVTAALRRAVPAPPPVAPPARRPGGRPAAPGAGVAVTGAPPSAGAPADLAAPPVAGEPAAYPEAGNQPAAPGAPGFAAPPAAAAPPAPAPAATPPTAAGPAPAAPARPEPQPQATRRPDRRP